VLSEDKYHLVVAPWVENQS